MTDLIVPGANTEPGPVLGEAAQFPHLITAPPSSPYVPTSIQAGLPMLTFIPYSLVSV